MNSNKAIESLKEQWENLKSQNPHLRIRNAAAELGVSEVELLVTKLGEEVTQLRPEFAAILSEVEQLGKVMALTRNNDCVHERKGIYLNPDFSSPHGGLFVGEDIDLRIFLMHWSTAFAVVEDTARGTQRSLQFFGKDGLAMHKIYLTKDSDIQAFDGLVEKYTAENQAAVLEIISIKPQPAEKPDSEIDIAGFQEAWKGLKDTHDFFMILRKFGVSRVQALRLAPEGNFAKKIKNEAVVTMLERAAELDFPIMAFTGNRGNIQIHTGAIKKTLWHGTWFNVMDPDFNLHLNTESIVESWVVRKPTEDGIVTAVEVFDKEGEMIVQFFGKRKPGIPELEEWRKLVLEIE